MVLGRWGSFWSFVLLTTGIGTIAGVSLLVFNTAPGGFDDALQGFGYAPFFALPGAVVAGALTAVASFRIVEPAGSRLASSRLDGRPGAQSN